MTTEERLTELEKKYEDLLLAKSVVFTESVRKRVLEDIIHAGISDTTLGDINTTTNVAATPSNVSHASTYDRRLRVTVDGVAYYIGLYNT